MQYSQEQETAEPRLLRCESSGTAANNSVLLVIPERARDQQESRVFVQQLSNEFRVFSLISELPSVRNVFTFAETFRAELDKHKIKRMTVLGIGRGASVALALAVVNPKNVRRLVLINATSRMEPGLISRCVDRLERLLPLGLPLRPLSSDFDCRPFLNRIYCPVLVLTTNAEGTFVADQGRLIGQKTPNAWFRMLRSNYINDSGTLSVEMQELLREFLQVPPKRPQKKIA